MRPEHVLRRFGKVLTRLGEPPGVCWGRLGGLEDVAGTIFEAQSNQIESFHLGCHLRSDFCVILHPKIDLRTL